MKQTKTVLFSLLILLFTAIIIADDYSTYGFKCGINISTLTGNDVEEVDSKLGVSLGAFKTYELNKIISFQTELLFSMKGAIITSEYTEEDGGFVHLYEKMNQNGV